MENTAENKELCTPFEGFYYSVHDQAIADAVMEMGEDGEDTPDLDYRKIHEGYAAKYCECFADKVGLKLTFKRLVSPKEYNFETDRIFADIDPAGLARLWKECDLSVLGATAKDWFTSRSGFHSFYDPDWREWGPFFNWDPNQLGCLLAAWLETKGITVDECALMESAFCNGFLEELVWANTKK